MGPQLRKIKAKTKIKLKGSNLVHSKIGLSGLASERVFKAAFDNAVDAIFWADTKTGKIVNCNYAAERLLGRKKREIVGVHQVTLHPPQKREYYRAMFKKHIKSKKVFDDEAEIITKSGKIKPVRITATVIRFDDKTVIQGIFRDITEQKKIRTELTASEEKYRTLVEDAPIGIYYNDFNGIFIYGNKMAEKIIGYKSEELMGKSFLKLKLLNSKDLARAAKLLALNRIGKATGPDEFILNRKDKSKANVNITTRPVTVGDKRMVLGMVEDVTERRQAEESLRQSEEKLRSLVDSAPNFIMIVNKAGIIQFINRTAPGLAREDAVGRPIYDFIQPKHHAVVRRTINHIFKTGQASSYEIQGIGPSGRISWYVTNLSPIRHHGKVVAVTQIAADITERKQAEEALQKNENFLRSIFDGIQDGVSVLDNELNIVKVNKWMERMYAFHMPLVGRKCYEAYQERKDLCPWCPSVKTLKSGESNSTIVPYPSAKERKGWILLSSYPMKDASGKVTGIIEHVKDITDRKEAEEALRISEEQYRKTLDSMADPIHVIDANYNIILCNKAFREWYNQLGLSKKIIGKSIFSAFPFLPQRVREELKKVFFDGEIVVSEETHKIGGNEIILEVRKIPIFEAGKVIRAITILRDITERKHMDQMKENLIRDVSHSLKTPVAMLEMAYDMGGRAIKERNIERIQRSFGIAGENITRLRRDINNILDVYISLLTKFDQAKLKKYSSLRKSLKQAIAGTKHVVQQKKLSLKFNIASGADKILISERELTTLLSNIIDNALKFTERGNIINKDIVDKAGGHIKVISKGLDKGTTVIIDLPKE